MSWEKVNLGNVCDIIAGQSPESIYYNKEGNGQPFFQGKADFNDDFPTIRYYTTKITKIAKANDILLSVRAPVGPTNICNTEACIGRGLAAIRTKESVDYKYVYFYFKSIEKQLSQTGNGSTFSAITTGDVKNIQIPLPPLPTQQRIAEILDKADALRKKDRQLLQHYDDLAQSLFINMFGDPVRNEMGWEVKTIEQITKKVKHSIKRGPFGGALKKDIFVESGFLVYEQFHALNNDFTFGRYFINEKKYNELIAFDVKPGDIIISCSGVYLGKLAIVPKSSKPGIINQALLKITLDNNVYSNELFLKVFTSKSFKDKYLESDRGAAIPNFPPMSTFKKFHFINPPIALQNQFAAQIQNIEQQKEKVKAQIQESEHLFQALLQKAFSGGLN